MGLGAGLFLGNWIWGGRSLRGGAWWDGDELSVNEWILRWRRVRLMLGTWGGERLRRKGGFRFGCESRRCLPLGGQSSRGDAARMQASGSLGVKEPAFFIFSQADSGASAGRSPVAGVSIADILESVGARGRRLAGRQQQGRLGRCRRHGRWRRRRPVGGSRQWGGWALSRRPVRSSRRRAGSRRR